jgi:hypothetical protein
MIYDRDHKNEIFLFRLSMTPENPKENLSKKDKIKPEPDLKGLQKHSEIEIQIRHS